MKTSDGIKEIAPAFVKAQSQFAAATKDKTATVNSPKGNYVYKYNDLASAIECVRHALNENGIAFLQSFSVSDGYVTATTRFIHTSGEWLEDDGAPIPCPSMATPQAFGSAYTYSKRYGLQAFTGLPSEDDDAKKVTDESTKKTGGGVVLPAKNGFGGDKPITGMQTSVDAFDALDTVTKDYCLEHSKSIVHLWETKGDMLGYIEAQSFDTETKLALWHLLPSNVRSAIKHQQQVAALTKKQTPQLAEQA